MMDTNNYLCSKTCMIENCNSLDYINLLLTCVGRIILLTCMIEFYDEHKLLFILQTRIREFYDGLDCRNLLQTCIGEFYDID